VKTNRILDSARASPASLRFAEALGFRLSRVKGSHHIFACPDVQELLNPQEVHGMAKPYQVRQLLRLMERYNLQVRD
jgi:predicted RNA binding protein YcfA (HicA-like mRNA interferase family)